MWYGEREMRVEHIPKDAAVTISIHNVCLGHRSEHVACLCRTREDDGASMKKCEVPGTYEYVGVGECTCALVKEGFTTRNSDLPRPTVQKRHLEHEVTVPSGQGARTPLKLLTPPYYMIDSSIAAPTAQIQC